MLTARLVIVRDDRPPRRDVELKSRLRTDGATVDITIDNLSLAGFKAILAADIGVGTACHRGAACLGVREARVIWREGAQYGFEFAHPFRPAHMAEAQAMDNVVARPALSTAPCG